MVNKATILFARFVIALCIAAGCKQKAPKVPSSEKKMVDNVVNKNNDKETVRNAQKNLKPVDVISLKEDYRNGLLQFYNESGDVWKSFEVSDTFVDNAIKPFAQKVENNVLVFRCVGVKGDFYKIIVNEGKKVAKYLRGSSPYFNYETWPEHILKVFSVDFDDRKNPLRMQPSSESSRITFNADQFYHPIEIKGEWLKVRDDDDKEGWVKWRGKDGALIIHLYYDA